MSVPSLRATVAPRLPDATQDYDIRSEDAFRRVLNLYFSQLDNVSKALLSITGGQYLSLPHGAFQNSATQAVTLAHTPYVVLLNTTDYANGMSMADNKVTVEQDGIYNVQFSLQFENTTTHISEAFVWIRKNGADVPGTASEWAIAASHGAINGYGLGACNFFVDLLATDYVELVIAASDTGLNIEAYPAATVPFSRPSIPSSVVTLSFVSAIPS